MSLILLFRSVVDFKGINTSIQLEYIQLVKSDIKDIYNVKSFKFQKLFL